MEYAEIKTLKEYEGEYRHTYQKETAEYLFTFEWFTGEEEQPHPTDDREIYVLVTADKLLERRLGKTDGEHYPFILYRGEDIRALILTFHPSISKGFKHVVKGKYQGHLIDNFDLVAKLAAKWLTENRHAIREDTLEYEARIEE